MQRKHDDNVELELKMLNLYNKLNRAELIICKKIK